MSRGWTDNNGNKVVDCNLLNFAAQTPTTPGSGGDTCNVLTGNDLNFGGTSGNLTQVNPDTLKGWGVRENDWQWGITVQQEVMPRMSIEVGCARRWFKGVTVTDNLARTLNDLRGDGAERRAAAGRRRLPDPHLRSHRGCRERGCSELHHVPERLRSGRTTTGMA